MTQEIQLSPENLRALSSLQNFATDTDLRTIGSYEDALQLAERVNGNVVDISEELGSGFAILDDKAKLVGREFVLIQWRFSVGDFTRPFVSAGLVTKQGEKFIMNDGGTGIMQTLLDYSQDTKRFGGIKVPKGLRVSKYPTCPDCGQPMPTDVVECDNEKCDYDGPQRSQGETFYLDTSADPNAQKPATVVVK